MCLGNTEASEGEGEKDDKSGQVKGRGGAYGDEARRNKHQGNNSQHFHDSSFVA